MILQPGQGSLSIKMLDDVLNGSLSMGLICVAAARPTSVPVPR